MANAEDTKRAKALCEEALSAVVDAHEGAMQFKQVASMVKTLAGTGYYPATVNKSAITLDKVNAAHSALKRALEALSDA